MNKTRRDRRGAFGLWTDGNARADGSFLIVWNEGGRERPLTYFVTRKKSKAGGNGSKKDCKRVE